LADEPVEGAWGNQMEGADMEGADMEGADMEGVQDEVHPLG
jgi:uncharacterized protein YjbI with pentapeptide repeats